MPLRIFRSRNVTGANLVQILSVAGMFGMFFLGSLYLRRILGYDPLQIGLAFLPVAVVMAVLSVRYTDRLVMRFGARTMLFPGLALIAAALALFALAPVGGAYASHILPVTLLMGAGAGLCFPALMTLAMSGASPQDAGLASGLVNTTGQVGGALGLAVLATVSASRTSAVIGSGGLGHRGPDRRLPPGLLDRLRPGDRGHRRGRHGAQAWIRGRGGPGAGPRAGRGEQPERAVAGPAPGGQSRPSRQKQRRYSACR